eukprot:gene28235-31336_t
MLENEKKSWQERAEAAEQKLHEIDAQRDEKAVTLSQERGTTLKVLREHMEREEIDQVRIEQLQSEVLRLSEQLKIETTSINALKRQLLEYSVIAEQRANTLRDGICEPGMEETVELVAHLFNDQANPTQRETAMAWVPPAAASERHCSHQWAPQGKCMQCNSTQSSSSNSNGMGLASSCQRMSQRPPSQSYCIDNSNGMGLTSSCQRTSQRPPSQSSWYALKQKHVQRQQQRHTTQQHTKQQQQQQRHGSHQQLPANVTAATLTDLMICTETTACAEAATTPYYRPPSLTFAQWMLFCKDSETSDARANAHVRNNANYLLLSPTDCQTIFAKTEWLQNKPPSQDGVAAEQANLSGNGGASVDNCILSYESFLAAIIHIATRIRRPEVTFLSEASREYILRYLSKAGRVTPAGLKKGQVRTALQGTGSKSENNNSHAQHSYLGALESHASFPSQSPKARALESHASFPSQSPKASTPPSGASTPAAGSKSPKKSRNKAVSSANSAKVASAGGASDMAGQMTSNLGMGREEIAHSAIVRELEMMDVASQGRIPKEVVRRGGGFNLV